MTDEAGDNPGRWAGRRDRGDGERASVTSGAPGGTTGAVVLRAWLAIAALLALVTFIDVMTALDDARRHGQTLAPALPLTLEITSAIASLVACGVGYAALRIAPPGSSLVRTVAVHVGGTFAYSAVHVGLMTALRTAAFAAGATAIAGRCAICPTNIGRTSSPTSC